LKYLIVGLGNVGQKYINTRHNVGFAVIDHLADEYEVDFEHTRHAYKADISHRGRTYCLIKPTTLVNRSGKAVNYWQQSESIPMERLLVIVDDVDLELGQLRLKPKGGDAGHNGLKDIIQKLGTSKFPRLRVGIGHDFPRGKKVEYVLGQWTADKRKIIAPTIERAAEVALSFGAVGLQHTMTQYNE
jgi:PTH1 family peptidyl-tRNA hydrolase